MKAITTWMTERRFNAIDAIGIAIGAQAANDGYYIAAVLIWVIGAFLSALITEVSK